MYTVLGKDGCKFCDMTIELLESKGLEYEYIQIDKEGNEAYLNELKVLGLKTVPQIKDENNKLVGGYQELKSIL